MSKGRTYTVEHATGARWTSAAIEDAVALTGWEGWHPTEIPDLPVGLDLSGVKTKDDVRTFAAAVLVDLDGVPLRTTRGELEQLIANHLNQQEG